MTLDDLVSDDAGFLSKVLFSGSAFIIMSAYLMSDFFSNAYYLIGGCGLVLSSWLYYSSRKLSG